MNQIATSIPDGVEAVMPVITTDGTFSASLTLGVAHMRNGQVNIGWLVRDCIQRHISAVADNISIRPSDFRDLAGERAHCVVQSCVVSGELADFAEDDAVTLDLAVRPRAETGWRSLSHLRSMSGGEIQVELVTAFARPVGATGELVPAVMGKPLLAQREDPAAHRANCLASRACRWRAAADIAPSDATCEIQMCAPVHMDACGLVETSAYLNAIAQSEHIALAARRSATPITRREVHIFGTLGDGDRLVISSQSYRTDLDGVDQIAVKSVLRRGSDNTVIGASETLRQAAR